MPTKGNRFRPKKGLFYDDSIEDDFNDTLEEFLRANKVQKEIKKNQENKEEELNERTK